MTRRPMLAAVLAFAAWSAVATGQTRQLSAGLPFSSIRLQSPPQVSSDSLFAVYAQDALVDGRAELWSVAITGGASTRLDRDDGRSVRDFAIDGGRAVYSYSTSEWYGVPLTGGASVAAPRPVDPPVTSPDGRWTVYGQGVELWSLPTGGGAARRVSCNGQAVSLEFLGDPVYSVSADSATVVYVAGELWAGPISGSVCAIFADGFESGDAERWQ